MRLLQLPALAALIAVPLAGQALATRQAPETITVDLKLNPTGAAQLGYSPQRLPVVKEKPASVKREPGYKGAPSYGELKFGSEGAPSVLFVLDRLAGGDPLLYVDANRDGDLTNDAAVKLEKREQQLRGRDGQPIHRAVYVGQALLAGGPGAGEERYALGVYHFAYKTAIPNNDLVDTVLYYRQYSREGSANLAGKQRKVLLLDETATGRFDQRDHPERTPPRIRLLVDRDGDGRFEDRYEAFDAAQPFNIGGTTYEVAQIDPAGARLVLKKSATQVAEVPIPPSFKVGEPALAFKATTMDGKAIEFPKTFAGKVVMLDFWATWCGPCVRELPHMVKAYEKYRSQGFEILGISLDQPDQKEKVEKFLAEWKMGWPQVYDGGFWKAAVAQQYFVDSIPRAYLIDGSTGKILAEGNSLRGEGLDRTIATALGSRR